jgi:replicative superfamily II helicase
MWRQNIGTELLPLQVTAINDYGILDGESVFISAPTSSGKTFIGELAAVKNMMEGRKVVFLLPYRALVNEKFESFTERYQEKFNIKVTRCSGDYLDQTKEFLNKKYDIAFLTYEMFLALVVNHSNILDETGLIVIDEAQFIGNDNRGIVVELILTRLRIASQEGFKPQLLLLSATVGDINHFNDWLGITYLCTKERPVPLEFGVVDRTGIFQFKDKNGNLKKKQLFDEYTIRQYGREPGPQDLIVPICKALMKGKQDIKILVFRNTRRAAEGCAKYLSKELGLDSAAEEVPGPLTALDVSSTAQTLEECTRGGTAFHNSNLTREQRSAVETSFRNPGGKLRVLVSTSTLAAGINTPASYVIIVEHAYPWEDRTYSVGEVQNMAGRAGRLGFQETGTAIMTAGNSIRRQNLFDKYVDAVPDPISSSFKEDDLGTWIIKLLAQVDQVRTSELPILLLNTFGGYLRNRKDPGWCKNISQKISDVLDVLLENELIEQNGDHLKLTLLGSACGQSSFSLPSCLKLLEFFSRYSKKRMLTPMELAALIQGIPELDSQYVPLNKRGNSEAKWPQIAHSFIDSSILSLLRLHVRSYHHVYARCKKICIIKEWIDGTPIDSIEANFTTNPYFPLGFGDVRAVADSTRFHLRSAFNILHLYSPFNCPEPDSISNFLKQIELGIPGIALDLLNLPVQLERGEYLALVSKGIITKEQFLSPKKFKVVKKMIRPGLLAKIL